MIALEMYEILCFKFVGSGRDTLTHASRRRWRKTRNNPDVERPEDLLYVEGLLWRCLLI